MRIDQLSDLSPHQSQANQDRPVHPLHCRWRKDPEAADQPSLINGADLVEEHDRRNGYAALRRLDDHFRGYNGSSNCEVIAATIVIGLWRLAMSSCMIKAGRIF
jgi:hypothetical protein